MTRKPWKRRGIFYTILTDVLFNLLAFYMMLVGDRTEELTKIQAVVPGLQKDIKGLRGELKKGKKELTRSKKQGDKYRAVIAGQDVQIGKFQTTVKDLTGQISEIKKHFRAGAPVTIVILIDVSASLDKLIEDLLVSMSTLFESLPDTSKDFRVSILAFRYGVVAEFPLTQILPYSVDQGASQQSVLAFIELLTVQDSFTNFLPVFKKAFVVLNEAHPRVDPARRERLILISDTGPSESDKRLGYSDEEQEVKRRLLSYTARWAKMGNRGVVTLYAESANAKQDPGGPESKQWFEDLGNVSQHSAFYTNSNHLLRAILRTSRD